MKLRHSDAARQNRVHMISQLDFLFKRIRERSFKNDEKSKLLFLN